MEKNNISASIGAYIKETYNVQVGDIIKYEGSMVTITEILAPSNGNILITLEGNRYSRYVTETTFTKGMGLPAPVREKFWIARDCIGLALCLEEPEFNMGVLTDSTMVYIPDSLFPEIKMYEKRKVRATTITI